jgi:hypothetical protein
MDGDRTARMTATLGELPLDDLLALLAARRATGTLSVTTPRYVKKLYLLDGTIGGAASNDPCELLGHVLVGWGLIDAEQLGEAMRIHGRLGTPLGRIVERMGLVDAEGIRRALVAQAEDTVLGLFLVPTIEQRFLENVLPSDRPLPLRLDVAPLVIEGNRRRQRAADLQGIIGSPQAVPRLLGTPPPDLSAREAVILSAVDGRRNLEAIALACHVGPFHVAELIARAATQGLVAVSRPATASVPASSGELVEVAHRALEAGDLRGAWEVLERLRQAHIAEARSHAARIERSLAEVLAQNRISGDMVPVLAAPPPADAMASLRPAEAYVLSRVNQRWTLREIQRMTPVDELQFGTIVYTLMRLGILVLNPPTRGARAATAEG